MRQLQIQCIKTNKDIAIFLFRDIVIFVYEFYANSPEVNALKANLG